MWKSDHKEGWEPKNWCFQTVVLEKTLQSPLDCKEIKRVNLKGNQPSIFIGRTGAEAPVVWPPDAKGKLNGKDEMVRQHHQHNGRECEETPGDGEGQGSLVFCSPWGCKECDMTYRLNNSNSTGPKVPFDSRLSCYLWRPGQVSSCLNTIGFYTCGLCLQYTEALICMGTL